ncbi:histidine phosphatase family protein [Bacillus spongiae]|uniref:Histidine phosphatase family protein n=1 Tax=Bacillus spongiae TaxID=2683610 RepID=A0ABU8HH46_9BACI
MKTTIYMVRHGDSPKVGNERTRGLTTKGKRDANEITELLKGEEIDIFLSSPYDRAILTIEEMAQRAGKEIVVKEDLKERVFFHDDNRHPDNELFPVLEKSFSDPTYSLPGGESNQECQQRAVSVLNELLTEHQGRKMAIGTHGAVMTLMMHHYDKQYDLSFLLSTSKPDVYKMEFNGQDLVDVQRLWHKE